MRALFLLSLLLWSCRDNPSEVLERASQAAAKDDLVETQSCFSVTTVQRLERAWRLEQRSQSEGWQALGEKLTFSGNSLEIDTQQIYGDYAQIIASAGATKRDYYLRKEDGRWRIELGAGPRFRKLKAKMLAEAAEKEKK